MAYTHSERSSEGNAESQTHFEAQEGGALSIPGAADAELLREGADLILQAPDGSQSIVHGYFSAESPPVIQGSGGVALTPALVESFVHDAGPVRYAAAETASDVSPVGKIDEMDGQATIVRTDGTKETAAPGMPVYQGDVIETGEEGSVNVVFADETSFAVSENARLAIDEYVYNPGTESGETHFSVLRGVFVFTSGLVGRDDPDDVKIETPMGSIGIRGTIIAGNANSGEITVVEGAIVLRAPGGGEVTLANQFDTARFTADGAVEHVGTLSAGDLAGRFSGLSNVIPGFFSAIGAEGVENAPGTESPEGEAASPDGALDGKPAGEGEAAEESGQDARPEPGPDQTIDAKPEGEGAAEETLDGKPAGEGDEALMQDGMPQPTAPGDGVDAGPMLPPPPGPGSFGNFLTGDLFGPAFGPGPGPFFGPRPGFFGGPDFGLGDQAGDPMMMPGDERGDGPETGDSAGEDGQDFGTNATDPNAGTFQPPPPPPGGTTGGDAPVPTLDLATDGPGRGVFAVGGSGGAGLALAGMRDTDGDGFLEVAFVNKTAAGGQMMLREWNPGMNSFVPMTGTNLGLNISVAELDGLNLVSLGDINRDGKDDFAAGSGQGTGTKGDFSLYSGDGLGVLTDMLSGSGAVGDHYGSSVSGAGDVNNDGRADVLIGAPGAALDTGRAVLFFGKDSLPTTIDPTGFSASLGIEIDGASVGAELGKSMAAAGDFNDDGIGDFVIGAPGEDAAYVIFGKALATGWTVDLTTVDPSIWIKITGPSGSAFGNEVASVGDMNGDGKSDILIATDNTDKAYVVYGGLGANLDVASLNGTNGFTIDASASGLQMKSGGAVGDFNGDGRDDFAVVLGDGSGVNDIYVVYGRDDMTTINGSGVLTLADLEREDVAFTMIWDGFDGESISITAAGDVTGDGRDDMLIGSDEANGGAGDVLLVAGRGPQGINPGSVLGTDGTDVIVTGVPDARINAGSGSDHIRVMGPHGPSVQMIDGGAGVDVMHLEEANLSLDFSRTGSAQISGIEKIVFHGVNQTLKLGIEDIFQLMQQSADHTLRIMEGAGGGGTLQIDNNKTGGEGNLNASPVYMPLGFAYAGTDTTADAGVTYDKYTFGDYTLLVDQNVVPAVVV